MQFIFFFSPSSSLSFKQSSPQLPPPIKSVFYNGRVTFDGKWGESRRCDTNLPPIVGNEQAIRCFIRRLLMKLKYSAIIPACIYNYCQRPHTSVSRLTMDL